MTIVEVLVIPREAGLVENYEQLSSLRLESDVDEALGSIIGRAEAGLGEGGSLGFLSEADESGRRRPVRGPSAIPDTDGSLRWLSYGDRSMTLADLDAAKHEGLFEGDARAFLLDRRPIGNGGLVPWGQLDQWLDNAGPFASAILALRGLISLVVEDVGRLGRVVTLVMHRYRVRRDTKWLTQFFARHKDQWLDAGAGSPSPLLHLVIERREWDAARLARYLKLTKADARRFLEVMGYELNPYSNHHVISRDPKKLRVRRDFVQSLLHYDPLDDLEGFE